MRQNAPLTDEGTESMTEKKTLRKFWGWGDVGQGLDAKEQEALRQRYAAGYGVEMRGPAAPRVEEIPLRARVEVLNGYSAHGDRTELLRWIQGVREKSPALRQVHLVHGEPEAQDVFGNELRGRGMDVTMPIRGSAVSF